MLRRLKSASGHQTPCTVKSLLCVGEAATEETTAAVPPAIEKAVSRLRPPDADSTLSIDSAQQDSAVPAAPGFGDLAYAPVKRPGKSSSIPLRSIPSELPLWAERNRELPCGSPLMLSMAEAGLPHIPPTLRGILRSLRLLRIARCPGRPTSGSRRSSSSF